MSFNKLTSIMSFKFRFKSVCSVWFLIFVCQDVVGASPSLHYCPYQCNCNKLTVDCSNEYLSRVPDLTVIKYNVVILNLTSNEIQEIRTSNFLSPHLTNLQVLHLNLNTIYYMEDTSFSSLPNLTYLDLSNNLLENVPSHIIERNTNLQKLNLMGNMFRGAPNLVSNSLVSLNLSFCKIERFVEENVRHLPNLQYLDLSVNMLMHVHHNIFTQVPIKSLRLANNPWKCNCNTIRLHHHLLKLEIIKEEHTQCLHSNKAYESVYNLSQPIHLHKFCIKELSQSNHKGVSSPKTQNYHNFTKTKHNKVKLHDESKQASSAFWIVFSAAGVVLLIGIFASLVLILTRRFVSKRKKSVGHNYANVRHDY